MSQNPVVTVQEATKIALEELTSRAISISAMKTSTAMDSNPEDFRFY